jgi:hypothetical protein
MMSAARALQLVGPLHAPLHVAAIVLLDGDALSCAGCARCRAPWPRPPRPSRRDDDGARLGCGLARPAWISRSMPAAQPMPAVGGSAQLRDQPVVAAAAQHRALGAEMGRHELEGGVGVVVEAAHQRRIDLEFDAERRVSPSCTLAKKSRLAGVQVIRETRRVRVDRRSPSSLLSRMRSGLRARRLRLNPPRAGPRDRNNSRPAGPCDRPPALRVAERIDLQHAAIEDRQPVEDVGGRRR